MTTKHEEHGLDAIRYVLAASVELSYLSHAEPPLDEELAAPVGASVAALLEICRNLVTLVQRLRQPDEVELSHAEPPPGEEPS